MNIYFLLAGILSIIIGLVHSILGEVLIFKTKRRKGRLVPSIGSESLRKEHLGIIWATWHLTSVFGWILGARSWLLKGEEMLAINSIRY